MSQNLQPKGILVTGVIGEDVHVTGIRILEHALRKEGFEVHSLGIHNSQEDFISEAVRVNDDALLISSLTGHASMLVEGFKDACTASGLKDVLLYIGGHLTMHAEAWSKTETFFLNLGFDRVSRPFQMPDEVIKLLNDDLAIAVPGEASA